MPIAVIPHVSAGVTPCLAKRFAQHPHHNRPLVQCHAHNAPPTLELDGTPIGRPTLLHTAWWRFGHWLHAHYFRQRTIGAHHLPQGGLFVLASNHASHLDCSSVFTAAQRGGCAQTYALGARDYFFTHAFVVR